MKNKFLYGFFVLFLLVNFSSKSWSGDEKYLIMKPDHDTFLEWMEARENAPPAYINGILMENIPLTGSYSVLPHLNYIASDRNQGYCGNSWVWAGTGVMEIALDVQEGIFERLSVQYVNSCDTSSYACCGGWLEDVADFYTTTVKAIPWSNTNAHWQDGGRSCSDGSSLVSCASISTNPSYGIVSIANTRITTQGVSQATAINNIKNVLHQDKGVWFRFFLATDDEWDVFFDFWSYGHSTDLWNPDYSCGHTWIDGEGGSHAVLIVGYNDDNPEHKYWIVLNSWGTTANRADGLFRLDMDMDYSCYFIDNGSSYWSHYFETLDIKFGSDEDGDGIPDDVDNCPKHPNGEALGTCVKTKAGMVTSYRVGDPKEFITCTSDADCEETGGTCQLEQGDCNANGCGDVCECYMDCNNDGAGDGKVTGADLAILKQEYGRFDCSELDPCYADGNEDGKVTGADLMPSKNEYGRFDCPACP